MNEEGTAKGEKTRGARASCFVAAALCALVATGCETLPEEDRYAAFRERMPRSILVLPPLNESLDADAPGSWLTTVSEPLAERGYYVFPVALVDAFMRDNGLPEPADMHAVPLARLVEVFDPDAVLYVTLEEFGQKFELVQSATRVKARGTLVDADTGTELWTGTVDHAESSFDGSGSLLENVIGAAVAQMAGTVSDRTHEAAAVANSRLVGDPGRGLLLGPLHPEFEAKDRDGG